MNKLTANERFEMIEELEEIQCELGDLVERLSNICEAFDDRNAEAYLIAPLKIRAGLGGYLSMDLSLPKWIERLREETGPEEDEND